MNLFLGILLIILAFFGGMVAGMFFGSLAISISRY